MKRKKNEARDSLVSDKEKKSKKVSHQAEKTKFRGSSSWQKWRKVIKGYRGNRDYITQKPLRSGWNCHHMDLDENHYQDITNPEHFYAFNSKTHDFVHWGYTYYKEDKEEFIKRISEVWEEMYEINEKPSRND